MKQYINITIIHYIINKIKSYINQQLKDISGDTASPPCYLTKTKFFIFLPSITGMRYCIENYRRSGFAVACRKGLGITEI